MTVKPASAPVLEAAPPPVVAQPQPTVIVVQSRAGHPPAGVPEGGMWIEEKYCGSATWIIGLLIVPCVFLCPLDTRTVYVVNGVKYNPFGAVVVSSVPC
ncbi:unnamed protein product [Ascophyllum nodosum]